MEFSFFLCETVLNLEFKMRYGSLLSSVFLVLIESRSNYV